MDSRPSYLQGRGRGRGRGGPPPSAPSSSLPGRSHSQDHTQHHNQKPSMNRSQSEGKENAWGAANNRGKQESAEKRFENISSRHQESLKKHMTNYEDYESSEDEEELNDDGILQKLLNSYPGQSGDGAIEDLGRTEEYVMNQIRSGVNICLICIESVKRTEAIWGCEGCYCVFHISCIQRWVKDGVYQQTALSKESFPEKDLPWHCPKCRYEYKQSDCPTRYFCFCGKEEDPTFDPWLVPHSCGQTCGRSLKPECGHNCLLLCHPGPCPPCPKMVKNSCFCEKQSPQTQRCSMRDWSCGQPCGRTLSCGHHKCTKPCHQGACPACPETSLQVCECGKDKEVRPCASPVWHCKQMCGRQLSCGHHVCEKVCRSGQCGQCPRSGERSCPCGKTKFTLPCTEDIPTCQDTCEKFLECGLHQCSEKCHTGPCGTCRHTVEKKCHCGQRKKAILCYKDYTCETKCTKMRQCGKHPCKKKCCDGSCPRCELQCNKTLGCRNHKCASPCHTGPCYPCPLTVEIKCTCGATSITVPCGREKTTNPPKCRKPCRIPPDCHHETRDKHRCHKGRCPACRQICGRALTNCDHTCPKRCHTAVLTKIQEKIERAGPWVPLPEARVEVVEQPCPPCQVPIAIMCEGKHERSQMACCELKPFSCERECGRLLPCGNHNCQLLCHEIKNAPDDINAGENCEKCEQRCSKPRPMGCKHRCALTCHPDECPPCGSLLRMRCHCAMLLLHIECDKWTHGNEQTRIHLQACTNQCPKPLSCGHQCTAICHQGKCPSSVLCNKKTIVRCPCRRRKRDFPCHDVQAKIAVVECDKVCKDIQDKIQREKDEKEQQKKEEELRKQREEVEEFERRMRGRRRKPRKQRVEVEEPTFFEKHRKMLIVSTAVAAIAIVVFFITQMA